MTDDRTFPPDLLTQGPAERLAYFDTVWVPHRKVNEAEEKLRLALKNAFPGLIVLLLGPPGAGKTAMLDRTETWLKQLHGEGSFITIQLAAPDASNSITKHFYRSMLKAGNELTYHRRNNGAHDLRDFACDMLRYRNIRVVITDEGHHFTRTLSGKRLADQMDAVKSIANEILTSTQLIAGTYQLLEFLTASGELARRITDVELERYDKKLDQDVDDYRDILFTFQKSIPIEHEPDLSDWEYFYDRTIGLPGLLKALLYDALKLALEKKSNKITLAHFGASAKKPVALRRIFLECSKGKALLKTSDSDYRNAQAPIEPEQEEYTPKTGMPKRKGRQKPGVPLPKRNRLGPRQVERGTGDAHEDE